MTHMENERDWSAELEDHLHKNVQHANRIAYKTRKGKDISVLYQARLLFKHVEACSGEGIDNVNDTQMPPTFWDWDNRLPPDTFGDGMNYGDFIGE